MKELINVVVSKIERFPINTLTFMTNRGKLKYKVSGNKTTAWIKEIVGRRFLEGALIEETEYFVENKFLDKRVEIIFHMVLVTSKGRCDIQAVDYHNGYWGNLEFILQDKEN